VLFSATRPLKIFRAALCGVTFTTFLAPWAAAAAAASIDFNRDIRPILSDKCIRCHGPDESNRKGGPEGSGGLRLDQRASATLDLGGKTFAIVPGDPTKSELLARITATEEDEVMPPRKTGKTISPAELALLRRWIAEGANYAQHWSYEPPRRAPLPAVKNATWARTPIDRFLLAKLEDAKLSPQPEADRATLARRVALDLTGLPPTLAEVDAFGADRGADAYEKFVDRQLAKPSYGEHWARAWLDLARYADSKGYADDQPRTIWRYRDYVIDAFNRNVPFDQFTIEQLAGDLLPDAAAEQVFATGFHRNTMNNTEGGTNDEEFRTVAVVDRVNTTMAVWMGTSMACAQCHTHKYDPLTQKEYFQLYAILNQTEDADRNDESPTVEFFSDAQQKERDAAIAEIATLQEAFTAARPAHVAAAQKWAREFPRTIAWQPAKIAAAKSAKGGKVATKDDGRVSVTGGQKADTLTMEIAAPAGENLAALRLESLPAEDAGKDRERNFVITRVRLGVKPAEAFRRARFVRVEMPGANRTLALAEVQVFSGSENIAPRGVASQVSTAGGAVAARASDGETDGDPVKNSNSETEAADNPWWEIDLGAELPVERVVVWGRKGLDPTPGGLRVTVLDAERLVVYEQIGKEAPKPNRAFALADPRDVKLARAVADAPDADYDENSVTTDAEPRVPAKKRSGPVKRVLAKRGWNVTGAEGAHTLSIEPEKPLTLAPGETLIVTIERQTEKAGAMAGEFRVSVTSDPRAKEHLSVPAAEIAVLALPEAARDAAQRERLLDYYVREVAPELRTPRTRLATLQRALDEMPLQTTLVLRELVADQRRKTHVQLRGNYLALGEEVSPGVPAVFPPLPAGVAADRLALARWLVSAENPLTARVQANRLWEAIFGLGLVRTSEEFGSQGEPPSHSELLDWLALELREGGWDTKKFLKLLVTSAAYRQSARVTPAALEADPENRLLARGPRFRLSAEMVRDQALAVSGLLNPKTHGPSARPHQPAFGLNAAFGSALDWKTSAGDERFRRGLYTEWRRSSPYPSMVTFDAPNREVCTLRRNRSNTPLQALVTLNDPVYIEAAQALARRLAADGEMRTATPEEKVRAGFRRVLLRAPTEAETKPLLALYRESLATCTAAPERAAALIKNADNPPPTNVPAAELAAWTTVANVLLNLDEALMKR
jgi:hypothetical protein